MDTRPTPKASGELGKTSIAQVLWYACSHRLTGTLVVTADTSAGALAGETRVALVRGAVAMVRLPSALDPLGVVLLDQRAITPEQLDESRARVAAREGLQGDVLVAMGACDRAAVTRALGTQVRRQVLRLFALTGGRFAYYDGVDLLAGYGRERAPVDLQGLLWAGVRAHPRHPAIADALARLGNGTLRLRSDADVAALALGAEAAPVLDALREGAAPLELARVGTTPIVARALVYLLAVTRHVEALPADQRVPRGASGVRPTLRAGASSGQHAPVAALPSAHAAAAGDGALALGEACLRRREFDEAETHARAAVAATPDDPDAMALLGAVLFERDPAAGLHSEAEMWLDKALERAPDHDRAHVVLGYICQRRGDRREGLLHFHQAYKANPRNLEAVRELRLAQMRRREREAREQPKGVGGLLARWLGRK